MSEDERVHGVTFNDREIAALERALITRNRMLGLVADTCAGPEVDAESDMIAHVAGLIQQHKSCDCE